MFENLGTGMKVKLECEMKTLEFGCLQKLYSIDLLPNLLSQTKTNLDA